MAIGIHVVRVNFLPISKKTGLPIDKSNPNTTIGDTLQTEHKHVILPDVTNVPNSANYPTIETFLKLEAAAGFVANHISQNLIVTYSATDINAA